MTKRTPQDWFISDTHFGHTNVIKYCNRPHESVEEMNQALVDNWNAVVHSKDNVYHLGDWAFKDVEYISQLKGNIITIPGNHDIERNGLKNQLLKVLPNGFEDHVYYYKMPQLGKKVRIVLCHYPLESWRGNFKYHLHGHSHGESRQIPNRLDVGVDATRLYRPLHITEVLQKLGVNLEKLGLELYQV